MSEAELVILTRPERIYLAVDVGRRHHVVSAVARSTFEEGGVRWQSAPTLKVEVNRAGFERIAALVAKLRTDERVEVVSGVEPTGGYYARTVHAFLVSLGVEVHWVKNAAVHDARDAIYGRKTKTDPDDARLIARLLYLRDAVGQEYAFSTGYDQIGAYATLRLLVGNRWRLRQAQARAGNQLSQILDVVFPEMAEVFAKTPSSDAALRLLDRYPTPKAVVEAGHDEVYRVIVFEARAPRKAPMVPKLIELAEHSVGIAGGIDDVIAAERYLVGQLLRFDEEVAAIEERIVQTLAMVPEGEIICSFPAAKEMRAATILGAMGAPVAAFHSDMALRRHLGWSVEEERSGSSVAEERLSRSGNRPSGDAAVDSLAHQPEDAMAAVQGALRPPGRTAERQATECRPGAPRLQAGLGDVRLHGAQRALRREASGEGHGHRDREAGEGLRLGVRVIVDQGLSTAGQ